MAQRGNSGKSPKYQHPFLKEMKERQRRNKSQPGSVSSKTPGDTARPQHTKAQPGSVTAQHIKTQPGDTARPQHNIKTQPGDTARPKHIKAQPGSVSSKTPGDTVQHIEAQPEVTAEDIKAQPGSVSCKSPEETPQHDDPIPAEHNSYSYEDSVNRQGEGDEIEATKGEDKQGTPPPSMDNSISTIPSPSSFTDSSDEIFRPWNRQPWRSNVCGKCPYRGQSNMKNDHQPGTASSSVCKSPDCAGQTGRYEDEHTHPRTSTYCTEDPPAKTYAYSSQSTCCGEQRQGRINPKMERQNSHYDRGLFANSSCQSNSVCNPVSQSVSDVQFKSNALESQGKHRQRQTKNKRKSTSQRSKAHHKRPRTEKKK